MGWAVPAVVINPDTGSSVDNCFWNVMTMQAHRTRLDCRKMPLHRILPDRFASEFQTAESSSDSQANPVPEN